MNETKKQQQKVEPRRKLTLHSETLRRLGEGQVQFLEGVVGGTAGGTTACAPTEYSCACQQQ